MAIRSYGEYKPELRTFIFNRVDLDLPAHLLAQVLADRKSHLCTFLLAPLAHVMNSDYITFQQVEYVWQLLFWNPQTSVRDLEAYETRGPVFLVSALLIELFVLDALQVKLDNSPLSEFLSVKKHVSSDAHEPVLVTVHHVGECRVEYGAELDFGVGKLWADDSQHVLEILAEVERAEVHLQIARLYLLVVDEVVEVVLKDVDSGGDLAHEGEYVVELLGLLVTHFLFVHDVLKEGLREVHRLDHPVQRRLDLVRERLEHHVPQLVDQLLLEHLLVLSDLLHAQQYVLLAVPADKLD